MDKQRGFSLLEILIAFAILALSLGILLKIFSAGVNTAGVAEEYTDAVRIAESLMAGTGVESPLKPSLATGVENKKYHWRVAVSPFLFTAQNLDTTAIPAMLFKVKVSVSWDAGRAGTGGRQVELTTLRLANKAL